MIGDWVPASRSSPGFSDRPEENLDFSLQRRRLLVEFAGIAEHALGHPARLGYGPGDIADCAYDLARPGRGALNVERNFARRVVLLADRLGHDGGNRIDFPDDAADRTDGARSLFRNLLHPGDLGSDLVGCFCRLVGKILYLGGNDREAFARIPRARRLDGGIEGQKVGLARNVIDHVDDLADLVGGVSQSSHRSVGTIGLRHRALGNLNRIGNLTADFRPRRRQFFTAAATACTLRRAFCDASATVLVWWEV